MSVCQENHSCLKSLSLIQVIVTHRCPVTVMTLTVMCGKVEDFMPLQSRFRQFTEVIASCSEHSDSLRANAISQDCLFRANSVSFAARRSYDQCLFNWFDSDAPHHLEYSRPSHSSSLCRICYCATEQISRLPAINRFLVFFPS